MTLRERAFAGLPMDCPVIDAHTHITGYYRNGWHQMPEYTGVGESLRLYDALGVDCIVTAPHCMVIGEMEEANDTARTAARDFPGRVYGYLCVFPGAGEEAVRRELARVGDDPAFVGLKFLGGYHGSYLQPGYRPALAFAQERACPILMHTWGDSPALTEFEELARAYPRAKLIMAHMGGGNAHLTHRAAAIVAAHDNIFLEICGSLHNTLGIADLCGLLPYKKIIFGTDFINLDPKYDFGRVAFAPIPDEWKRAIFAQNFLRLLGDSSMGQIKLSI